MHTSVKILLVIFILFQGAQAEEKRINMICYPLEPTVHDLPQQVIPDSIETYIQKYSKYLYDPLELKHRMQNDLPYALDQLGQRKIFPILQRFIDEISHKGKYRDTELSIKIHFILWNDALEFLKNKAVRSDFSIAQIGSEFLGGLVEEGDVLPLNRFFDSGNAENVYSPICLKTCRLGNKHELWALPFWASLRTMFVRQDMISACPGLDPDSVFTDWNSFLRAGLTFNANIPMLQENGFPNLESFLGVNIGDRDLNILQTLMPPVFGHCGGLIQKKMWWQECALDQGHSLNGIKTFLATAKAVGSLEELNMGLLLDQFHAGHFAMVMCGTWDHSYWRTTNPDSSSYIQVQLPPAGPCGRTTLLDCCNLALFRHDGQSDYRLEFELMRYLSSDLAVQLGYVVANDRLSVIKSLQEVPSHAQYYAWLNDEHVAQSLPNTGEMYKLFQYLSQKYALASVWQNVKGANELTDDVWRIIENGLDAIATDLNREIVPPVIYSLFYTKISFIYIPVILTLLGGFLVKIVKIIKNLQVEKQQIERDLNDRLKRMQREKTALQKQENLTKKLLQENEAVIASLRWNLEQLNSEYDHLKNEASLEKIEQLSGRILGLTSTNNALQIELDHTTRKILETDRVVSKFENEIKEYKNPEIYIDFRNKTIYKKNGSEFILSSAAKQYKNDVFRFLEFMVRSRSKRFHLVEFGYFDAKHFLDAISKGAVKEYTYRGKFPKVKSGINRTFKENIGKELLVQDHSLFYVYFQIPDKVYRIHSKDNDIDIAVLPFKPHKAPELVAFSAYDDFDFYAIHDAIQLHSNIQEAFERYDKFRATPDRLERREILEEAHHLDSMNDEVLVELLRLDPLQYFDAAQKAAARLRDEIKQLDKFIQCDWQYFKKLDLESIREHFKEMYAWKYVNRQKMSKLEAIGRVALTNIFHYDKEKLIARRRRLENTEKELAKYFENINRLKELAHFYGILVEKNLVRKAILNFFHGNEFIPHDGYDDHWKNEITKLLCQECWGNLSAQKYDQLTGFAIKLFEWFQAHKINESPVPPQKLQLSLKKCEIPLEFHKMFTHFFLDTFGGELA